MAGFNLQIFTPNSVVCDKQVEKIIVRTVHGDVGVLRNHVNYISTIKNGLITIFNICGSKDKAILKDGFISVLNGKVTIMVLSYNEEVERQN